MSKIKITTVSGAIIEKPIVTCFKGTNGSYLVLDNESNGTMGLPIILVCKLFEGKLIKIIDQGEWQNVKENLKAIIANKTIEYEKTATEFSADDVYYTQLTLPVNSFETLKNNYAKFDIVEEPVSPLINQEPVVATEAPIEPIVMPDSIETVSPITPTPVANVEMPVAPENITMPETPVEKVIEEPVPPMVDVVPSMTKVEEPQVVLESRQTNSVSSEIDIDAIKQTFMKACENMFDALLTKFQSK